MSTEIIHFQREFQLWRYTVGHGQLLLRSTKSGTQPTRIDVLFKNVRALHLASAFEGLSISEASEVEKANLHLQVNSDGNGDRRTFIVRGKNFLGYVIASTVVSHEDEGEYDDPTYFNVLPVEEP